jgi:hypothetical protein
LDPFTGDQASLAVQSGAGLVFTFPPTTIKGDVCGFQAFTGDPAIYDVEGNVTGGDYILENGGVAYMGECSTSPEVTDMLDLAMDVIASPMLSGAIGGRVFDIPGTYSAASLTVADNTNVILRGDENSTYLFQSGSYMVTGANTHFILQTSGGVASTTIGEDGAFSTTGVQAKNVLFALTAAATTGAGSTLRGSIVSGAAATFGARTDVSGYVLATAAITVGEDCFLNKAGITAIAGPPITSPITTVINAALCYDGDDPVTGDPTFDTCPSV